MLRTIKRAGAFLKANPKKISRAADMDVNSTRYKVLRIIEKSSPNDVHALISINYLEDKDRTSEPTKVDSIHATFFLKSVCTRLGAEYMENIVDLVAERDSMFKDHNFFAKAARVMLRYDPALCEMFGCLNYKAITHDLLDSIRSQTFSRSISTVKAWQPETKYIFDTYSGFEKEGPLELPTPPTEDEIKRSIFAKFSSLEPKPAYSEPMVFQQQHRASYRSVTNIVLAHFKETPEENLGAEFVYQALTSAGVTGISSIRVRPKFLKQADDKWLRESPLNKDEKWQPVFAFVHFEGPDHKATAVDPLFSMFGIHFKNHRIKVEDADLKRSVMVMNFGDAFEPKDFLAYLNTLERAVLKYGMPYTKFECDAAYLDYVSEVDYAFVKTNSFLEALSIRTAINFTSFGDHRLLAELEFVAN